MDDLFPELFDTEEKNNQMSDELIFRLSRGRDVEINPYISNDFKRLREHYTILLEYCKELENKITIIQNERDIFERKMNWLNRKLNEREG